MLYKTCVLVFFYILGACFASSESLKKFSDGNRIFAASTHKEVGEKPGNFLVCQFSVETVLSLVQNGAKGETCREIKSTLHLPKSKERTNNFFKSFLDSMEKKNESYTFQSANKIYVKKDLVIKEKFLQIADKFYKSSVENLDFVKKDEAVKVINEWVSQRTNSKIHDLVNSDNVNEETVAVLVNALYLQANWRKSFKTTLTKSRDFFKTPEDVVQVSTMKKRDYFGYFESETLDAKFLKMPFQGDGISMIVVLPNQKDGLESMEKQSLEAAFQVSSFTWEMVEVTLPKFKIATSINFKEILIKLGMKKAFTRADFSNLAGARGEIYISDVIQKTFIGVDESGVEAAASTSVHFHPKSLLDGLDWKTFTADHPFIFYIQMGDIILFSGRVVDPSQ